MFACIMQDTDQENMVQNTGGHLCLKNIEKQSHGKETETEDIVELSLIQRHVPQRIFLFQ